MRLLDLAVRTPLSEALGWTLFDSLWEGIVIAAVLGALLASVRSSRIRYAAGCVALFAMFASFVVTLIHFLPESGSGAQTLIKATHPAWGGVGARTRRPGLDGEQRRGVGNLARESRREPDRTADQQQGG